MVWKLNLDYLYANISLPLLPFKKRVGEGEKKKKRFMNYAESPYARLLMTGNIKGLIV